MEDVFDARPAGRSPTIEESLIFALRLASGAPIDPVSNASSQRGLAMRLIPVGLVSKYLPLISMQQLGHLCAVMHVRRSGSEAVNDAVPVGAHVRLHAKMPVFSLLGLADEEKADVRKTAGKASRIYFILSLPMLLCMGGQLHGLPF